MIQWIGMSITKTHEKILFGLSLLLIVNRVLPLPVSYLQEFLYDKGVLVSFMGAVLAIGLISYSKAQNRNHKVVSLFIVFTILAFSLFSTLPTAQVIVSTNNQSQNVDSIFLSWKNIGSNQICTQGVRGQRCLVQELNHGILNAEECLEDSEFCEGTNFVEKVFNQDWYLRYID